MLMQASLKEGGEFQMFGGSVVGKYLALKPYIDIQMEWRFRNWREADVSKVGLFLSRSRPLFLHLTSVKHSLAVSENEVDEVR